jgi:hypothetical protein
VLGFARAPHDMCLGVRPCRYGLGKRLIDKPLKEFSDSDLMLRLVEADKEQLATLKLHCPKLESLISQCSELYASSE